MVKAAGNRLVTRSSDARRSLGSAVRAEITALLDGGGAHASFEAAVKGFPVKLRGAVPRGLPYSGWQIVEHLRLAQRDMLEFSDNADGSYQPKQWPEDYWPKEEEPPTVKAWEKSLAAIRADRKAFDQLLAAADDKDLVKPFAWGKGQSLLKEALQLADHNAYHVGELIVVRRILGCWK
jgi:hypothetical protein